MLKRIAWVSVIVVPASLAMVAGCKSESANSADVANATQVKSQQQMNDQDRTFIQQATAGGNFEIRSSQLAQSRSQNGDVKSFAGHMITDHTAVNDKLVAMLGVKGVNNVPPDMLDADGQRMITQLSGASGTNFDTLYAQDQVTAHQKTISAFQQEANNGGDPDLKGLASTTLPKLQEHLKMAQDLQGKVGGGHMSNMNMSQPMNP